jgi:tetratricopeptide (TPR) repeat protein
MGNLDAAIANYQRALSLDPSTTIANNFAECLMAAKRWEDAGTILQTALREDARVELENNMGLTLIELKRPREAIDHLESALGLLGADAGHMAFLIQFNLARAWDAAGNSEKAIFHARKVREFLYSPDINEELPKEQLEWITRLTGGTTQP